MVELLQFAEAAAASKVANYVLEAHYDSKANLCTFELAPSVKEGDAVANAILEAARATIGQFYWFDVCEHGAPADKYYASSRD